MSQYEGLPISLKWTVLPLLFVASLLLLNNSENLNRLLSMASNSDEDEPFELPDDLFNEPNIPPRPELPDNWVPDSPMPIPGSPEYQLWLEDQGLDTSLLTDPDHEVWGMVAHLLNDDDIPENDINDILEKEVVEGMDVYQERAQRLQEAITIAVQGPMTKFMPEEEVDTLQNEIDQALVGIRTPEGMSEVVQLLGDLSQDLGHENDMSDADFAIAFKEATGITLEKLNEWYDRMSSQD